MIKEIDERYWEAYLLECRAMDVKPSLSDYVVFLDEMDKDTEDWE